VEEAVMHIMQLKGLNYLDMLIFRHNTASTPPLKNRVFARFLTISIAISALCA
jgi:hypothetical protein